MGTTPNEFDATATVADADLILGWDVSAAKWFQIPLKDFRVTFGGLSGAMENLSTAGLIVREDNVTAHTRVITFSGDGVSVADGDGVNGDPTLSLANDLSALEGLGSTGLAARTGTDAWAQRAIQGTTNQVAVADGDGVSANPTLSLPSTVDLSGKTLTLANDQISGDKVSGGTIDGTSLDGASLASGLNVNGQPLQDGNGNEQLVFTATGSAVNHVDVTNAATGNGPTVQAVGGDTNVDLNVSAKGTGAVSTTGMTWDTMG